MKPSDRAEIGIAGKPATARFVRWAAVGTLVFAAGILFFFYKSRASRLGTVQPIAFSHRIHAGVEAIPCAFCHPYVKRSIFPGMPPVEKCLFCHRYIIARQPEIRKIRHYFDTNTPIPWKKLSYLPEYVVFRHQRHIRRGIACQACHGPIQTMDRIPRKRFTMGFCLGCHRLEKVDTDCWLSCHN